MYVLPNISRSKDNWTMKFGQLLDYNMKNHTQNVAGKLFSDPFLKNFKLNRSLDQLSKLLYSLFLSYAKLSTIEIYLN